MGLIALFMASLVASFAVVSHLVSSGPEPDTPIAIVSSVVEILPVEAITPSFTARIAEQSFSPTTTFSPTPTIEPTKTPAKVPTKQPIVSSATPVSTIKPTTTIIAASPTSTPTPTVTLIATPKIASLTPVLVSATQIDGWFEQYSREYGVDISVLRKIAVCESGYNTNSRSKYGYGGMFQFSESAWRTTRTQMGLDTNPDLRFNPQEAIHTAAHKISKNGTGAWPACSK